MLQGLLEKIKALAQWWYLLERVEHRHWCLLHLQSKHSPYRDAERDKCDGSGGSRCWLCVGITCANVNEKDCPACVAQKEVERVLHPSTVTK
jgi:hypothetical protein